MNEKKTYSYDVEYIPNVAVFASTSKKYVGFGEKENNFEIDNDSVGSGCGTNLRYVPFLNQIPNSVNEFG